MSCRSRAPGNAAPCRWQVTAFGRENLNRIGAMVVDIRPATGTAVSLEDFLGRNRFEIGTRPFLCVAGSSPLLGLSSIFFAIVFPVNRRDIFYYFGLSQ